MIEMPPPEASSRRSAGGLADWLGRRARRTYLAAASVWRYHVDADSALLPFAQAAIRVQLDLAAAILKDLYANLPSPTRRVLGAIILRGTGHLALLRDRTRLDLAERLRTDRTVIDRLCSEMSTPRSGGVLDLMQALELARGLGDEVPALNKLLRRVAARGRRPSLARSSRRSCLSARSRSRDPGRRLRTERADSTGSPAPGLKARDPLTLVLQSTGCTIQSD